MAGNRKNVEIFIRAQEQASAVYGRVERSAKSMGSVIQSTGKQISAMGTHLEKVGAQYNRVVGGLNTAVKVGLAGATAAAAAFTVQSSKTYAEFEKQHAKTMGSMSSSYSKTTEDQARFMADQAKLQEQAKKLGRDPLNPYRAVEISAAQTNLIKAGLDAQQTQNSLPNVINFAQANETSLDLAAEWGADISSMFGIASDKWGEMFDKLTKAADMSTIDVDQIYETLKYAGPSGAATETSFDEILGLTAMLGNKAIKDSMSGTSLQALLSRMLNPRLIGDKKEENAPDGAAYALDRITSEIINPQTGGLKSWPEVIDIINKTTEKLNIKSKDWVVEQLAGLENKKGLFALMNAGSQSLKEAIDSVTNGSAGINEMKAELLRATQSGDILALVKALDYLEIQFGKGLSPAIRATAEEMLNFFDGKGINYKNLERGIDASVEKLKELNPELAELTGSIGRTGAKTLQIGFALSPMTEGFGKAIYDLLTGHPVQAAQDIQLAVKASDLKIENLPGELQGLAKNARAAAIALFAITSFNIVGSFAGKINELFKLFKLILIDPLGKLLGGLTKKNATEAITKAVNMTVQANVVNVYGNVVNGFGGKGGNPFTGGSGTGGPGGGLPIPPLILPGNGTPAPQLTIPGGGGSSTLMLGEGAKDVISLSELSLGAGGLTAGVIATGVGAVTAFVTALVADMKSASDTNEAIVESRKDPNKTLLWDDKHDSSTLANVKRLLTGKDMAGARAIDLNELSNREDYIYSAILPKKPGWFASQEEKGRYDSAVAAFEKGKAEYEKARDVFGTTVSEYLSKKAEYDQKLKEPVQNPIYAGFGPVTQERYNQLMTNQSNQLSLNVNTFLKGVQDKLNTPNISVMPAAPPNVKVDVKVNPFTGLFTSSTTYENISRQAERESRRYSDK